MTTSVVRSSFGLTAVVLDGRRSSLRLQTVREDNLLIGDHQVVFLLLPGWWFARPPGDLRGGDELFILDEEG